MYFLFQEQYILTQGKAGEKAFAKALNAKSLKIVVRVWEQFQEQQYPLEKYSFILKGSLIGKLEL